MKKLLFLFLLFPLTAWASFPSTAVLSNFNGTDGAVLTSYDSTNWGTETVTGLLGQFKISSNQATPNSLGAAGDAYNYWKTSFGANQEAFCTFKVSGISLFLRIQNPTNISSISGYLVSIGQTDSEFFRIDNGSSTLIASGPTFSLSSGDVIGASVIGNTITLYVNGVPVGNATDSTYTNGGFIGILTTNTADVIDNFGGGNVQYGDFFQLF